jgi:hypothetical protein
MPWDRADALMRAELPSCRTADGRRRITLTMTESPTTPLPIAVALEIKGDTMTLDLKVLRRGVRAPSTSPADSCGNGLCGDQTYLS